MRGLSGKGVLITGGSSGIGFATAERFLREGSRVFICGIEEVELQTAVSELASLGTIQGATCDVSSEEQVSRLVDSAESALGIVDVLINNAGISKKEAFVDVAVESWDRIIAVNLRGMFLVGQAISRAMIKQSVKGAIVNMASTNALVGEDELAPYNASKGGVLLLTKTMAIELGKYGIRVNALCPGYIWTPLSASLDDPDKAAAYAKEKIPLGRIGRPEEVAAAFAFLASEDASFIHGEALVIDGGQIAI